MIAVQSELTAAIRSIPDYPKPGIVFRDITTLLGNPRTFRRAIDELVPPVQRYHQDVARGPEAPNVGNHAFP